MEKMNLKQKAYTVIRERIESCEYEPSSFLNEDILCRDLNMSRTPVRDALSRLEQEGLVRILPKKGVMITPIGLQDIKIVYDTRALLECYIIENSCGNLSDEVLEELKTCMEQEQACIDAGQDELYLWDYRFHKCIISQSDNKYVLKTLEDVQSQNTRLRMMTGQVSGERLKDTMTEHRRIYEALKEHDAARASDLMREHINRSKEASAHYIVQNSIR